MDLILVMLLFPQILIDSEKPRDPNWLPQRMWQAMPKCNTARGALSISLPAVRLREGQVCQRRFMTQQLRWSEEREPNSPPSRKICLVGPAEDRVRPGLLPSAVIARIRRQGLVAEWPVCRQCARQEQGTRSWQCPRAYPWRTIELSRRRRIDLLRTYVLIYFDQCLPFDLRNLITFPFYKANLN